MIDKVDKAGAGGGREDASAYVKAFAGVIGKEGHLCPWGDEYRHLPVTRCDLPHGTLWTFGTATETAYIRAPLVRIVGRPFLVEGGPQAGLKTVETARSTLPNLDGRFALFCGCNDGRFVLATDWLGAGPMFVGEFKGEVYFASHLGLLTQLLDTLPSLDQLGVASMLGGSTMVGGRTPHQGIRRLMAGEMAVVTVDGQARLSVEQYADPVEILTRAGPSAADPLEEFDALLVSALKREKLESNSSVLMLSGGLDSTALAYAMKESGMEAFPAATFGESYCSDLIRGRNTARQLGMPHRRIPYSDWTLQGEADFIASLSGGSSGLQTSHNTVPFRDMSRRAGTAVVGFLGGDITGDHLSADFPDGFALPHVRSWSAPIEELYREELKAVRQEVHQFAAGLNGLPQYQKALMSDFLVRQATWISQTFSLCGWWMDLSMPFYHRDLITYLFNLPEAELRHQALYRRWSDIAAARLRRRGSSVAAAWTRLQRQVRLRMNWRFGTPHPDVSVDWRARMGKSGAWLEQVVERFDEDQRLQGLARDELSGWQTSRQNWVSPIVYAASIMLARQ